MSRRPWPRLLALLLASPREVRCLRLVETRSRRRSQIVRRTRKTPWLLSDVTTKRCGHWSREIMYAALHVAPYLVSSAYLHPLCLQLVWDCGWLTPPSGGHAIAVVIARDTDGDTGSVTICNSGDGLGYHPASVADYPKTKHRTALHLRGIAWWRLEDDSFVYTLLRPFISRLVDRTNGAAATALYAGLLPQVGRTWATGRGEACGGRSLASLPPIAACPQR